MPPSKYADIDQTTIELKQKSSSSPAAEQRGTATSERPTAPSVERSNLGAPSAPQTPQTPPTASAPQTLQPAGGQLIPSNEHTARITALATYTVDAESDGLVRIYDGVTAQRDDVLLVQRKELIGKTPEAIQAHFSLSFLPRLMCDASVPIGHRITMGKLTNAAGKRVSIFKALTALGLSSERPLTPENIPCVRLKTPPLATNPSTPHQPLPPTEAPAPGMFNLVQALQFLQPFSSPDKPAAKIPDSVKMMGPDAFPYVSAQMRNGSSENVSGATGESDGLLDNLLQSLLNEGYGLVLWGEGEKAKPTWVYKYRDLLCFKLFNSLQPPPDYDETLYAATLDKPIPAGSRIVTGHPSTQMFPSYARNVLSQRIGAVLDKTIKLDPRIIEYPDVDRLKRFRLNLSLQNVPNEVRTKIGEEAAWCLPYVVYF